MLAGTVHPLAKTASDQGGVDASLAMKDMLLTLRPSADQAAALKKYVDDLHNPNSPNFHKWLTPALYAEQFGANDADVEIVRSWLTSNGFSVDEVSHGKNWIRFSGNAAQVENAFQTQIHQYSISGLQRYANATNLSIPAALDPAVTGVVSTNNFLSNPQHTPPGKVARNQAGKLVRVADTSAGQTPLSAAFTNPNQTEAFLMPGDFSKIYDAQSVVANGIDGSGVSIAVVGRSDISMSDVEAFRTIAGLPFNDPTVIYATTDPGVVPGDDVEASLDVEWAGAIAPKAKIAYVVGATTTTTDGVDISASYIVDKALAPIMTVSFGLCEADMTDSQIAFYHLLWQQAAAEGITVFVSAGDAGSSMCNNPSNLSTVYSFGVSGLASTPYNVAVGGTEFNDVNLATYWNASNTNDLSSAKGYIPEAVWNESCAFGLPQSITNCNFAFHGSSFAGGGGVSSCASRTTDDTETEFCAAGYAKPSWQAGPGVPQDGVRDLPDVSLAAAGGHDGYILCVEGSCQWTKNSDGSITLQQASIVGGTSAASPSMASIMALIEQKHGQFQGVANYQLYQLAAADKDQSCDSSQLTSPTEPTTCIFHDITLGSNAVPCLHGAPDCQGPDSPVPVGISLPPGKFAPNSFTDGYASTGGYDLGTGLGSVDVANLVEGWGKRRTFHSRTTLNLSQTIFQHGTSITFSGKVVGVGGGTPSGEVLLTASTTTGAPQSTAVVSGAYSASTINLPGGQYTLTAEYSGDSVFGASSSRPVVVTVTPENSVLTGTSFAQKVLLRHFSPIVVPSTTGLLGEPFWLQFQVNGVSGSTDGTGTIKLSQGNKVIGTYPVSSSGQIYVQCGPKTPCDYWPGTYTFKADYSGGSSFNPSSTTLAFEIVPGFVFADTRANTITPVAGSRDIAFVTFRGPLGPTTIQPTGVVILTRSDTGAALGTGTIDNTGTATIPFNSPAGEYFLTPNYAGDANYTAVNLGSLQSIQTIDGNSGTQPVNISVNLGKPTFALGERSSFSVTVAPATKVGTALPTGTVTLFSNNGQISGQIVLAGGKATGTAEWDAVGAQGVYAVYAGDTNFAVASSTPVSVNVAQGVPTVTVQPRDNVVRVREETSITALLTNSVASTNVQAPTGTIQLFDAVDGDRPRAIGVPQVVISENGALGATLATTLPKGVNVITAIYSGDANWKSVVSAPSVIDVKRHRGSDDDQ
ncbi:Ig-like domain repeat protein [Tunturiibacter lichenicola]|uniref:Ig-like domain repeat protein n=1 Tax=Tunturiibacter lichenicola TaxID=2051959 RepID=UPI003D9AF5B1